MPLSRERIGTVAVALVLAAMAGCQGAWGPADPTSFGPQPTPEMALRAYMEALELGAKDPNLALFTPETRRLPALASVSDAQQKSELRTLRSAIDSISVRRQGTLAVIRFAAEHRKVAPYFFRRGDDGWMLDLATSSRVLVFNREDEWGFRSRDHEYAFAFD